MNLKNKIPPPLVTLLFGMGIYFSTELIHPLAFKYQGTLAITVLTIGLVIMVSAILTFRQLQTTINPLQPNKATSLAVSGVFRFSRNPMYLAMLLILVALSLASGALAAVFLLPGFVIYISIFQIVPEEQAMEKLFSDQYLKYCKKVRRWI
jgi:protein-S-isoprenylcysteine O-methyltransferase Ste14